MTDNGRKEAARKLLLSTIKIDSRIFFITHKATQNGKHHISAFAVVNGDLEDISIYIATFMGYKQSSFRGFIIPGVGFNKHLHVIQDLNAFLYDRQGQLTYKSL